MSNQFNTTNLLIGAGVSLFEVTTLGQPLEVLKTHMASHRGDNLRTAIKETYGRGKFFGFYQGLIPWGWIESSTAGGILLLTSSTLESYSLEKGLTPGVSGLIGGIGGGIAQGYLSMSFCTWAKTQEITRQKNPPLISRSLVGHPTYSIPSTHSTLNHFMKVLKKEGIKGVTKGSHAVALRQASNWGSRMFGARFAEEHIKLWKGMKKNDKLSPGDKILASTFGGIIGCWNQPIEVIRVEMQSLANAPNRPTKLTMLNTLQYIYKETGLRGLFRGVTPRIGLSVYRTICLVTLADYIKAAVA